MGRTGVLVAMALAAVLGSAPALVGAELPPGCDAGESFLLDPTDDSSLGLQSYLCGIDAWMIAFEIMTSRDEYGRPKWEMLDAVEAQGLGDYGEIALGTCARDDAPDPDIVAVVYRMAPDDMGEVYRAWSVDRAAGRLWPTSTDRITCAPVPDHCGMTGDEEIEWPEG